MSSTTKHTGARHPPAFATLALGSLGTGFATYGVSAILILYLYTPLTQAGLGLDKVTATQILAVFTSISFIAGMIGSYAADRLVGTRRPFAIGNGIKAIGIALLAVPHGGMPALVASLVLQVFGAGVAGQSLNALAGALYSQVSPLRDSAFALLYITANIGAAAPVITGSIALHFGYAMGFLTAAIVLALSLLPYVFLQRRLFGSIGLTAPDPLTPTARRRMLWLGGGAVLVVTALLGASFAWHWLTATGFVNGVGWLSLALPLVYGGAMLRSPKTTAIEGRRIRYFGVYLLGNSICMMVYGQSTGILALYAADSVQLNAWGLHLTPAAFQTVPAVLAIVFGTVMSYAWAHLGARQPSESLKFGLGIVLWGAGPLFMAVPLTWYAPGVKVSPLWLLAFYGLIVLGESLTAPIGTALSTRIAPVAFASQLVTVYALSQSAGAGLSALLANFYVREHEAAYFEVIGTLTVAYGIAMCVWHRQIEAGTLSGLQ
ncbi:peptide MFS transporter [Lacticaseibacillus absianus]|uniref:peptide MFS transporter n=1 Tax=Lacticaseibacillus absianus TaxID=2729623 RepID=UPI0015C74D22|nr:oligopeptide:H+ symporter [Lacticaseibacillus absianus]